MTPFDMAFFTFFILFVIKLALDTVSFWKEQDREASKVYRVRPAKVRIARTTKLPATGPARRAA
ncbi:MAG: hypothetical protein J5786_03345 [Clostridiales bacterium]|nr:hypothetical protein [Clostridiales bacterium]